MSYKVNTNARYIVKDAIDKLGLTHSKISEICNVSIGSIKRWISTGRANAEKIKPLENLLTGISTKNFVKSIDDVGEVLIKIYEKRNIFSIKSSTLSIMSGRIFIHDKFISQLSEYLLDRGFYILKNRNLECELYSIIGVDHLLKINSLTEEELNEI